jgi:hypothetical protein
LKESWEAPPNFFLSSATTREGRDDILRYINQTLISSG